MIRNRPSKDYRCRAWRGLGLLLGLWPVPAGAQPSRHSGAEALQVHVAATDDALWLALVTESQSGRQTRILHRSAGGTFGTARSTSRRVALLTAIDRDVLVFFDDAAVYRYDPDPARVPVAEAVLPRDALPLDAVGVPGTRGKPGRVYAVIPSPAAAELPATPDDDAAPASQPFDPGEAPLSLAVFDGRRWTAVAPLPANVRPSSDRRLRSRLALAAGRLWLFAPAEPPDHILVFAYQAETGGWTGRDTFGVPELAGFWAVDFNGRLTLVTARRGPTGGETIKAFRRLDDRLPAEASKWKPADLRLSALAASVRLARYDAAFGFNQHLGLLAADASGRAYLQFAYLARSPTEATLSIEDLLARPELLHGSENLIRILTFAVLLIVITGLFVFRRGSMVTALELPAGCALALNLQRLLGWLIDFAPFTVAAAYVLDVPWREGLRTLAQWGIVPDSHGGAPDQRLLVWWGLSVGGHVAYMIVMELIAHRTVGKVVARVYLLSESGRRPGAGQILMRNGARLIELMPQFWVFVVLVLLSRNRQRLGDIFARTVVIRLTGEQPADIASREARPGEKRSPTEPPPEQPPRPPEPAQPDGAEQRESNETSADKPPEETVEPRSSKPPDDQ